ncbi:hypothetical protein [Erwinia tasmaniensis]|uniref:hypothetical protein n=1 Tax=Erwinia tasmaniensis TaxID=338565 RepID=UPI003A4E3041
MNESFERYLDEVIYKEAGIPVTRRNGWSITRIQQARQVWADCTERANAASTRERAKVGGEAMQS